MRAHTGGIRQKFCPPGPPPFPEGIQRAERFGLPRLPSTVLCHFRVTCIVSPDKTLYYTTQRTAPPVRPVRSVLPVRRTYQTKTKVSVPRRRRHRHAANAKKKAHGDFSRTLLGHTECGGEKYGRERERKGEKSLCCWSTFLTARNFHGNFAGFPLILFFCHV